jgi:hypothetical protein
MVAPRVGRSRGCGWPSRCARVYRLAGAIQGAGDSRSGNQGAGEKSTSRRAGLARSRGRVLVSASCATLIDPIFLIHTPLNTFISHHGLPHEPPAPPDRPLRKPGPSAHHAPWFHAAPTATLCMRELRGRAAARSTQQPRPHTGANCTKNCHCRRRSAEESGAPAAHECSEHTHTRTRSFPRPAGPPPPRTMSGALRHANHHHNRTSCQTPPCETCPHHLGCRQRCCAAPKYNRHRAQQDSLRLKTTAARHRPVDSSLHPRRHKTLLRASRYCCQKSQAVRQAAVSTRLLG